MPEVSPVRLQSWFDELAAIGRTDGGWNRVAWTPLEAEARAWFTGVAEELGLEVRRDGAGTLWAVTGDADRGPWVCAGSHLDTQPDGGAFDGALGIVSALAAAAAVLEAEPPRRHPLAVVAFVDEEGARFRVPCFASLAITGGLDVERVLDAMDGAESIYDVTIESLRAATAQLAHVHSFLEVHVEQGRSLAGRDLALGIATMLAPRQRWRVEFEGEANHAGTTPMEGRRDARVAAAPLVTAADAAARARPGAVATVGRVEIAPGSTNSIPGRVAMSLDVRALDVATVDALVAELRERFGQARFRLESRNEGATFDAELRTAAAEAAARRGIPTGDLPSYAGHDAGILAPHVPSAMVFVRNPTGASHTPAESASPEDCLAGAQVLADVLAAALAPRHDSAAPAP
jgi:beta-ureidopropionase / N-carbamoyl-L-amino-acid hydrolase